MNFHLGVFRKDHKQRCDEMDDEKVDQVHPMIEETKADQWDLLPARLKDLIQPFVRVSQKTADILPMHWKGANSSLMISSSDQKRRKKLYALKLEKIPFNELLILLIFISDEKTFQKDQNVKRQNNSWHFGTLI